MQPVIMYSRSHPDFITVTCLEWRPLLVEECVKEVITASLSFLSEQHRVYVYAFVIMPNHFHLIWQMIGDHKREHVQRDFLRFTSQQILKRLRNENSDVLNTLRVESKDRKHQIWERNSLSIPLWTTEIMWQKLNYIHQNPVKAGLCQSSLDYKFSSALFYEKGMKNWGFLSHIDG